MSVVQLPFIETTQSVRASRSRWLNGRTRTATLMPWTSSMVEGAEGTDKGDTEKGRPGKERHATENDDQANSTIWRGRKWWKIERWPISLRLQYYICIKSTSWDIRKPIGNRRLSTRIRQSSLRFVRWPIAITIQHHKSSLIQIKIRLYKCVSQRPR